VADLRQIRLKKRQPPRTERVSPMAEISRDFQVFAKPAGAACNLECRYCYYLKKKDLYRNGGSLRMSDDILEEYIVQHMDASSGREVRFSWHGGEPTILGVDYFRKVVALQRTHQPEGKKITNGIQTNGTLLDEEWCQFFASVGFTVGISLDGPRKLHDPYRLGKGEAPTHEQAMRGYRLLREHGVACDALCVVHAGNVPHPLEVYRFFKEIGVTSIGFLPLVERTPSGGVTALTAPPAAFGDFLSTIFDEWLTRDIGRVSVQIFEEAIATAFGREHGLCIFRETCGNIPVVEHNGDFFSCDHFVDGAHCLGNIRKTPLASLLESKEQRAFGLAKRDRLPRFCRACEVLSMCNGGCPKDRFLLTADGEEGLNYLCAGYKRFFAHCRPFVAQVAALSQERPTESGLVPAATGSARRSAKIGRNDPCPCGSGKKYKKCCMDK
jgi:uncharacterized protein